MKILKKVQQVDLMVQVMSSEIGKFGYSIDYDEDSYKAPAAPYATREYTWRLFYEHVAVDGFPTFVTHHSPTPTSVKTAKGKEFREWLRVCYQKSVQSVHPDFETGEKWEPLT